jgi:hypothetical protein
VARAGHEPNEQREQEEPSEESLDDQVRIGVHGQHQQIWS